MVYIELRNFSNSIATPSVICNPCTTEKEAREILKLCGFYEYFETGMPHFRKEGPKGNLIYWAVIKPASNLAEVAA